MKSDLYDAIMRRYEVASHLNVPDDIYPIVRVSGRGFVRLTESLRKPYDPILGNDLAGVAEELVRVSGAIYGYSHGDEISILLPKDWRQFGRNIEKMASTFAGAATLAFVERSTHGFKAHFSGRFFSAPSVETVEDYFRWRQGICISNALTAAAYWALRDKLGVTAETAGYLLTNRNAKSKIRLLDELSRPFSSYPRAFVAGIGIRWADTDVMGFNEKDNRQVATVRRKTIRDAELSEREAYGDYIRKRVSEHENIHHHRAVDVSDSVKVVDFTKEEVVSLKPDDPITLVEADPRQFRL